MIAYLSKLSLQRQYRIETSRQTPKGGRMKTPRKIFKLPTEKFKRKKNSGHGFYQSPPPPPPPPKAKCNTIDDDLGWGNVLYEPGKGRALRNTCPIDNFLWICYCRYRINPDTQEFLRHSAVESIGNLNTTMEVLLSGCYDDAKYSWLLLNEENCNLNINENSIDSFRTDESLSYLPLKHIFDRTAESVVCTSQFCPGGEMRHLKGTDLHLPQNSDFSDDVIATAISLWESGGDRKMCNSFFAEESCTHDEYLRMEYGETKKSPVIKYQCNGEHILGNIKFVKSPPLNQFLLSEEIADKVSDVSSIQRAVNIHGENYVFGGCTVYIQKRAH